MAMFERRLFLKPICHTEQYMPSGVEGDLSTWTRFFGIPWDHLGYLKRIEIGRTCDGVSGCFFVQIWDNFYDPITEVSGLIKRKDITVPEGITQINWDETSDAPLIGDLYVYTPVSGLVITLCAQTMGC